jgi:hypothetical protein
MEPGDHGLKLLEIEGWEWEKGDKIKSFFL